MNHSVTPTRENIEDVLTKLLDPRIKVSVSNEDALDRGIASVYSSKESENRALCVADFGMAVLAGSSFLEIPVEQAHEMLTSGEIRSEVLQSYKEIANILSRVLCDDGYENLRLDTVYPLDAWTSNSLEYSRYQTSVTFDIEIPEYGAGVLAFLVQ